MHVFGCKPGRKWPFCRTDQTWTASPHGPTYYLQTAGGHIQTHSPHHWFKRVETIHLSNAYSALNSDFSFFLFSLNKSKNWGEITAFASSSAQHVSGVKTTQEANSSQPIVRHFHIILTLSTCLNHSQSQTFYTVCGGNILFSPLNHRPFSSLYSKHSLSSI